MEAHTWQVSLRRIGGGALAALKLAACVLAFSLLLTGELIRQVLHFVVLPTQIATSTRKPSRYSVWSSQLAMMSIDAAMIAAPLVALAVWVW